AVLWAASLSRASLTIKNIYSYLFFISMLAAPVDLLAGLVCLVFKKKTWASALLWSGAIFILFLVIGFLAASI
ncbi:MAG: hypothetical protein ACOYLO_16875, partial [Ferruginibacter sp.]